MFLSLFSAFVRGDLECLREWADVSTPFSSPQLRSILSLELTEKHPEPESQNLLQWPGSSRWKILFPVSFSPCFLLKVSPLAVTIRSQPPTYCVVFHYYQNGDAKHNCPSTLPQGLKACVLSVGKKWITWRKFTQLSYPYRKPNRTYTGNHFLSWINYFNGLAITCGI